MKKVSIIGAAVMDILAGPVGRDIFDRGSVPADKIEMKYGGDALNEAVILSNLGVDTEIVTLLGRDEVGDKIIGCLKENGIGIDKITFTDESPTGTNIVLVDKEGERFFITNPASTLRKLSAEHILSYCDSLGDIVSFASIFVSPKLGISDMSLVFQKLKEKQGRILVADMTTAKNGEKIEDLAPVLKYLDYIIPNEKEAYILTGESDPNKAAECFTDYGAKAVIIKCGKAGCVYRRGAETGAVKAYLTNAIDTTGAGDGFVAGFMWGLGRGMDIEDCCRAGNATSSLIVEHFGTQGIIKGPEQVQERINQIK